MVVDSCHAGDKVVQGGPRNGGRKCASKAESSPGRQLRRPAPASVQEPQPEPPPASAPGRGGSGGRGGNGGPRAPEQPHPSVARLAGQSRAAPTKGIWENYHPNYPRGRDTQLPLPLCDQIGQRAKRQQHKPRAAAGGLKQRRQLRLPESAFDSAARASVDAAAVYRAPVVPDNAMAANALRQVIREEIATGSTVARAQHIARRPIRLKSFSVEESQGSLAMSVNVSFEVKPPAGTPRLKGPVRSLGVVSPMSSPANSASPRSSRAVAEKRPFQMRVSVGTAQPTQDPAHFPRNSALPCDLDEPLPTAAQGLIPSGGCVKDELAALRAENAALKEQHELASLRAENAVLRAGNGQPKEHLTDGSQVTSELQQPLATTVTESSAVEAMSIPTPVAPSLPKSVAERLLKLPKMLELPSIEHDPATEDQAQPRILELPLAELDSAAAARLTSAQAAQKVVEQAEKHRAALRQQARSRFTQSYAAGEIMPVLLGACSPARNVDGVRELTRDMLVKALSQDVLAAALKRVSPDHRQLGRRRSCGTAFTDRRVDVGKVAKERKATKLTSCVVAA